MFLARQFAVGLMLAGIATLTSCSRPAAPGARGQLLGAWDLESRTVTAADGRAIDDPVLGAQPIGRLFYAASGHMALQMMRQGRPRALTEPADPGQAGNARIVTGYDAYFGRFTIDEGAGTITHHIEGSLFPEDLGKDFVRRFRLEGDTFELSFASPSPDGSSITRRLVFRRSR